MTGYWVALQTACTSGSIPCPDACPLVQRLWTLTPRVACLPQVLLADVSMSLRLFGGASAVRHKVRAWALEQGVLHAWAPTGGAAQALLSQASRDQVPCAFGARWSLALDAVPVQALPALQACIADLHAMGCHTLGQFRRLPRKAALQRLGDAHLRALDQAYGVQPEAYAWLLPEDAFERSQEPAEDATTVEQLLACAEPLLLALQDWLRARQLGATVFALQWRYGHRARDVCDTQGQVWVRSAHPMYGVQDFRGLLAVHLSQQTLLAPVNRLTLRLETSVPAVTASHSWLPDPARQQVSADQLLERIQARLGPSAVRVPVLHSDHRPERMQTWEPWRPGRRGGSGPLEGVVPAGPVPTWILPEPLPLPVQAHRPVYRGALELLLGPERIEVGWWEQPSTPGAHRERRDYWLAYSAAAGLLWVFQRRRGHEPAQWFLHGFFG